MANSRDFCLTCIKPLDSCQCLAQLTPFFWGKQIEGMCKDAVVEYNKQFLNDFDEASNYWGE